MPIATTDATETERTAGQISEQIGKLHGNQRRSYLVVKRFFDILASGLALIALAVPMLFVAVLIKLESPGPVIYKQKRLGKNGNAFWMYKFRSMRQDAEKNGPQWATYGDPRCTKVGRVIRMWHIDELPQLVNVIKGEMSIVGPRPEREYFYAQFETEIPGFHNRLAVDQGLTCIAQVNGCYDLTPAQRYVYDIEYIQKQSLWTDLVCILKTFAVIVNHKGAR